MDSNIFVWLSHWYSNNCDGNWEHYNGIKIETIDNPGWSVSIDTEGSSIELIDIPQIYFENEPDDWYGYKVEEKKFEASGDPPKLEYLINIFRKIIDSHEQ